MEKKEKLTTEEILKINVNDKTEKKNGLTYLSWSFAWELVLSKIDSNATYEVVKFENKPYIFDENLGYLVMTKLTINGLTREMYLPVMDGANKAQKNVAYKYSTKFGEKIVLPATMFDINTALQRCLVKNIAMFGLALYIYEGEGLPTVENGEEPKKHTLENVDLEDNKKLQVFKKLVETIETKDELGKLWLKQKNQVFKKIIEEKVARDFPDGETAVIN